MINDILSYTKTSNKFFLTQNYFGKKDLKNHKQWKFDKCNKLVIIYYLLLFFNELLICLFKYMFLRKTIL